MALLDGGTRECVRVLTLARPRSSLRLTVRECACVSGRGRTDAPAQAVAAFSRCSLRGSALTATDPALACARCICSLVQPWDTDKVASAFLAHIQRETNLPPKYCVCVQLFCFLASFSQNTVFQSYRGSASE